MKNNIAAVILAAGKGSRMNDDSTNKVCFTCAGIPVIRRIMDEMRRGGVSLFVIVVGHKAQDVMDCLDGQPGVIYAYQKEQKGTGHAVLCGMNALQSAGYSGPVIVSMGDKIVASHVIGGLLKTTFEAKVVWGVQPIKDNPNGGRVVVENGQPYGVVEFADAALMSLADVPPTDYEKKLSSLGLNAKKAAKVLKIARERKPEGVRKLVDKTFSANDILNTPYANAGLYCFDLDAAIDAINACGSDNAQGEIYLTDTLEIFARQKCVSLYEVANPDDMLTYSTKPELLQLTVRFMRRASDWLAEKNPKLTPLLEHFIVKFGDKKVIIASSPGRINLMGRHIDHHGGGINVMAIDRRLTMVVSPRTDNRVHVTNINPQYPDDEFAITSIGCDKWLDYLDSESTMQELANTRGKWTNYIKAAIRRFQLISPNPLCGMDIAVVSDIPAAAGLSSSSAIVVATAEAVVALNSLHVSDREFIELCGEGEWFVGSRGGCGDHAAMKCGRPGKFVHLGFLPFTVGESASLPDDYAVIIADSTIKARKSEGSKDRFNAQVAAYDLSLLMLRQTYPAARLTDLRSLAAVRPYSKLYDMLRSLPLAASRKQLEEALPDDLHELARLFSSHEDPGAYNLRGVILYGLSEMTRSERFMETLKNGGYDTVGKLMKISHNGDRIGDPTISDNFLKRLSNDEADLAFQCGAYACSIPQIDELCDLLDSTSGVLGSELVGAGLGGCIVALVKKDQAENIINVLNEKYYAKYGVEPGHANVYQPSQGSSVEF
ncbi:MAG: NTP transferase domain-containing protein [Lentisphaeria bacterium]|nr:NTP transferase domain-containing protein [Lentisphaeria bacterium]